MDGLSLVPAGDLDAEALARVRQIFEAGFEPDLRSPFRSLLAERCLVLLDRERRAQGLAVLRDLTPHPWAFLRYFVVGDRGRGLGSAFWRLLREAHPEHTRILLDVEDPDEPGLEAPEQDVRRRRIGFYERLGVVLLPVHGYAPPHDGVPQPLRLMLADLDPATAGEPSPVPTPEDLREVVLTVYAGRYRLGADDPAVLVCLRASGLID